MRRLDAHAIRPAEIEEHAGLRLLLSTGEPGPPRWKVAVTTWVAVNLVTTPLVPFLPTLLGWAPYPWSNLFFNVIVVALLTWAVMPWLSRVFAGWLTTTHTEPLRDLSG